jgi:hypothetical protein
LGILAPNLNGILLFVENISLSNLRKDTFCPMKIYILILHSIPMFLIMIFVSKLNAQYKVLILCMSILLVNAFLSHSRLFKNLNLIAWFERKSARKL